VDPSGRHRCDCAFTDLWDLLSLPSSLWASRNNHEQHDLRISCAEFGWWVNPAPTSWGWAAISHNLAEPLPVSPPCLNTVVHTSGRKRVSSVASSESVVRPSQGVYASATGEIHVLRAPLPPLFMFYQVGFVVTQTVDRNLSPNLCFRRAPWVAPFGVHLR
jgi:hypothetical protein